MGHFSEKSFTLEQQLEYIKICQTDQDITLLVLL